MDKERTRAKEKIMKLPGNIKLGQVFTGYGKAFANEKINEAKLKKGDHIKSMGEVGVVNKIKGQVAYVKFDSNPKSFHPILVSTVKYKGKHKGKDLYEEGIVNEAVKPIKLSGNLKKDLKTVTDIAGKMVKYAKDNFNTYIPTGHMLSQLINGGSTEKDVLKYNISHLAKAINTDLKKKYMKDFVGESVNESVGGFRGIATGRSNFGKVRYDGWKRSHEPIKEAAPKMRKNKEAENLQKLMNQVANAQKGGGDGRYGKEFDKSKTKALRAIKDMVMYSNIGI